MSAAALILKNVSKSFPDFSSPLERARAVLRGSARPRSGDFFALRDISLEVEAGTTLGVLGQNGSGKSTLLQIMAGIMLPSSGTVETRGRISTILELGAGFNPDFTGRENVYLGGHILGMSPEEIAGRMEAIEKFAELGAFIDKPTRIYSSGMYVRLAFAVAVNLDPDILLIDEVLAVGDTYFRHKCVRRIRELQEAGRTIVFVTHDVEGMRNICKRAVIVDKSRLIADGGAGEIAIQYMAMIDQREKLAGVEPPGDLPAPEIEYARYGSGEARIENISITDAEGKPTLCFRAPQEMVFRFRVRFRTEVRGFVLGNILRNRYGIDVFGMNNHWLGMPLEDFGPGEEVEVVFRQPAALASGTYSLNPAASAHLGGEEYRFLDWINHAAVITVENPTRLAGYVELPCRISVEKIPPRV